MIMQIPGRNFNLRPYCLGKQPVARYQAHRSIRISVFEKGIFEFRSFLKRSVDSEKRMEMMKVGNKNGFLIFRMRMERMEYMPERIIRRVPY